MFVFVVSMPQSLDWLVFCGLRKMACSLTRGSHDYYPQTHHAYFFIFCPAAHLDFQVFMYAKLWSEGRASLRQYWRLSYTELCIQYDRIRPYFIGSRTETFILQFLGLFRSVTAVEEVCQRESPRLCSADHCRHHPIVMSSVLVLRSPGCSLLFV